MADLDDDATDGQMADFLAAEQTGDHGAWNMGIVEYQCLECGGITQIIGDDLPSYNPLIKAWHDKAGEGDWFVRFVFEYLSFIAHIKHNLYFDALSDRRAIQRLKQDDRIKQSYLALVSEDQELGLLWTEIIGELLHNSSFDPDNPEIDKWWNNADFAPNTDDDRPKGKILSLDDWSNMVEFWYSVRNNLFHGGKHPNIRRDIFLVEHAFKTLNPLVANEIQHGY